jgi:glutathione S-transferase
MNFWRPVRRRDLPDDVAANVKRIDEMWTDCRARFGAGGPFLFGAFSAADAMYAPVVSRFQTYDVPVSGAARAYMEAVMRLPAWADWRTAGLKEPWVLPEDEPDWPEVPRVSA